MFGTGPWLISVGIPTAVARTHPAVAAAQSQHRAGRHLADAAARISSAASLHGGVRSRQGFCVSRGGWRSEPAEHIRDAVAGARHTSEHPRRRWSIDCATPAKSWPPRLWRSGGFAKSSNRCNVRSFVRSGWPQSASSRRESPRAEQPAAGHSGVRRTASGSRRTSCRRACRAGHDSEGKRAGQRHHPQPLALQPAAARRFDPRALAGGRRLR